MYVLKKINLISVNINTSKINSIKSNANVNLFFTILIQFYVYLYLIFMILKAISDRVSFNLSDAADVNGSKQARDISIFDLKPFY